MAVLHDAEHFDPFFANACIACAQQLLEAQVKEQPGVCIHARRMVSCPVTMVEERSTLCWKTFPFPMPTATLSNETRTP